MPAQPTRGFGGRPSPKPRSPGDGPQRMPREVGDPRTVKPRGPLRPSVRPPLPQEPVPLWPNGPTPWWKVGLEMLASAATIEVAAAAAFLAPMGIVADHYLDRKEELERKPLFTPCGSEPHLRESELTRERHLSDMERLRRNLRWYADDDHNQGKLLDRDIDAIKILVADMERQDQLRELQTRLNAMNPGSAEAQQLRQKISNLMFAEHLPAVSSTAARAQANGDSAAKDDGPLRISDLVERQRFFSVLLRPDADAKMLMRELPRLKQFVLAELPNLLTARKGEIMIVLGGIEVLAHHQELSGSETLAAADAIRQLIVSAPLQIQKPAMLTYIAIVKSGYLSDAQIRLGVADMDGVADRNPELTHAVNGALLMLGAWLTKDMPAYTRVAGVEYLEVGDILHPIPVEVLQRPFLAAPILSKPRWSGLWSSLDHGPETRDGALSVAARAFSLSLSALWSPLLDEVNVCVDMMGAIDLAAKVKQVNPNDAAAAEHVSYLRTQREVIASFFDTERRLQLWMRIANGQDGVAKRQLLELCEQRLKAGGADSELDEIQKVRDVLLGRPEATEERLLERVYLASLWRQMGDKEIIGENGRGYRWDKVKGMDYRREPEKPYSTKRHQISMEVRERFFFRELTSPQSVPGVSRALQQMVALKELLNIMKTGHHMANGEAVYRHVAPLLVSENDEVAYGAAVVADKLREEGVQGVDNVRVQTILLRAAFARIDRRPYPGNDLGKLIAAKLLMDHKILTPDEVKHVAVFVRSPNGLFSDNSNTVQAALALVPLVVEQGALDFIQVNHITEDVVSLLLKTSSNKLKDGCLTALKQLVPHSNQARRAFQQLRWNVSDLPQPWKTRAKRILREIDKP